MTKCKLWKCVLLEVQAKNRENWNTFNLNYQQFEVGELTSIDLSDNPKLFKSLCRFWESFLNEFKNHLVQNLNINIQDSILDCRIFDHALTSDYNYPKYGRFAKVGREVLENNRAELDFFIKLYKRSRSELLDILHRNNVHLSFNLVKPDSCFNVDIFNIIVSCIPGDMYNYDQKFYCSMEQLQELNRLLIQILDSFVDELEPLQHKVEFKPQNLCSKIFKI